MATWTDIPNPAVSTGGAPRGSVMTALRDNPVAIAAGATGAPRIYGDAVARPGDGLAVLTVSAADTVRLGPGFDAVGNTFTNSIYEGQVRAHATHTFTSGSGTVTLALLLNGGTIKTWALTSPSSQARTWDVSVNIGDVISWQLTTSGDSEGSVSGTYLSASDGYVIVYPVMLASDM